MSYEFTPDQVEPDAVERADEADNPDLPEPSVGDPETSPVSEEEVTEHGSPSVNNASTEPAEYGKSDEGTSADPDENA